ncbi:MAG TPA: undecaprenyldiphospho-muramoylpentapeptide beta-N-acetylglucosaminyltransferase [Dissulfurispiraceae bacterium]|nr:undecaprenyldiphospho-muramoylpentapeptide beta-N-acetylglucosaminyltransferase [Dissulfurispiraceae bacterium]
MRVIIAGGGTGGHLFPGVAVAEEFTKKGLTARIVFVGTEHGIEARVIPKEGYPIEYLSAEGMVGKTAFQKARAVYLFLVSLYQARRIIASVCPDIVIGVGGYASVGMVFTAHFMGVRTIIMEQNSVPGFANKFLSRFVDAIAVTYQESIASFPRERTFLTGNPVRKKILTRDTVDATRQFSLARDRYTVLIFGGSLGARTINNAVVEALHYLLDLRDNIQFIHQTGEKDVKGIKEIYDKLGFSATVMPFIYQMADAYAAADLVICRAGATTLSELTAVGKAAVLVPYPYAASNHQEANARKLEDMGAATVILDRHLSGEVAAKAIRSMYDNPEKRKAMQKASKAFGRPDAAEKIVDLAMNLTRRT